MAMTKKKTTKDKDAKKKTASAKKGSENVNDDGMLTLSELEMSQLNLHEARTEIQLHVREKLQFKAQLMTADYKERIAHNQGAQSGATASMEEAKKAYNSTRDAIEKRLGVNLADYIVKDDGMLILAPSKEEKE